MLHIDINLNTVSMLRSSSRLVMTASSGVKSTDCNIRTLRLGFYQSRLAELYKVFSYILINLGQTKRCPDTRRRQGKNSEMKSGDGRKQKTPEFLPRLFNDALLLNLRIQVAICVVERE